MKMFNHFVAFQKLNHYIFLYISECQNYPSLNSADRKITYTTTAIIVTMESDLVGSVSRDPPVQECQLHVHLYADVALMQPAG